MNNIDSLEDNIVSSRASSAAKTKPNQDKKPIWAKPWFWLTGTLVIVLAVLGLAWRAGYINLPSDFLAKKNPIAIVNGQKIVRERFDFRYALVARSAQTQGIDLGDETQRAEIEKRLVDELVNTELLLQQSAEAGVTVDETAVENQYQQIISQFGSEEAFVSELASSHIDLTEVKQDIREQLTIQAFLGQNISDEDISVTEEEITAFYDNLADMQNNEDLPKLDDIRPQIEEQLAQQKTNQLVDGLINSLRAQAEIETLL